MAEKFRPSFRAGERVEIAPRFDQWMRGDRYGDVVKHSQRFGVYVKMDKSGKVLRFSPDDLTLINPRHRKISRRKISKRAARLMGRRRGRTVKRSRRNPYKGISERGMWLAVADVARSIGREATTKSVKQYALELQRFSAAMLAQLAQGLHENPTLAILGNPGKAKVVGTLSRRLYELRYKHAKDGKDYRHPFGPGASVLLLSDGNVLIRASHRLWEDI